MRTRELASDIEGQKPCFLRNPAEDLVFVLAWLIGASDFGFGAEMDRFNINVQ
jgi:hypothetical protein